MHASFALNALPYLLLALCGRVASELSKQMQYSKQAHNVWQEIILCLKSQKMRLILIFSLLAYKSTHRTTYSLFLCRCMPRVFCSQIIWEYWDFFFGSSICLCIFAFGSERKRPCGESEKIKRRIQQMDVVCARGARLLSRKTKIFHSEYCYVSFMIKFQAHFIYIISVHIFVTKVAKCMSCSCMCVCVQIDSISRRGNHVFSLLCLHLCR